MLFAQKSKTMASYAFSSTLEVDNETPEQKMAKDKFNQLEQKVIKIKVKPVATDTVS
jgi:uncharacterized membrane protein YqhA